MKIVFLIGRLLLGLMFLVFGLNGFLHFIPMQSMPPGPAGQFMGAIIASHEFYVISAVEIVAGALLLAGQFVPLALVLLGPIVVNILLFHIFMEPQGLPIALATAALWFVVFAGVRSAFAGIFSQSVRP